MAEAETVGVVGAVVVIFGESSVGDVTVWSETGALVDVLPAARTGLMACGGGMGGAGSSTGPGVAESSAG